MAPGPPAGRRIQNAGLLTGGPGVRTWSWKGVPVPCGAAPPGGSLQVPSLGPTHQTSQGSRRLHFRQLPRCSCPPKCSRSTRSRLPHRQLFTVCFSRPRGGALENQSPVPVGIPSSGRTGASATSSNQKSTEAPKWGSHLTGGLPRARRNQAGKVSWTSGFRTNSRQAQESLRVTANHCGRAKTGLGVRRLVSDVITRWGVRRVQIYQGDG